MFLHELAAKWSARQIDWRRLGALVNGEAVAAEVLSDLEALSIEAGTEELTLTAAGAVVDMNPDSIGRAIRQGRLANVGRKNAPRVRRADVMALAQRKPAKPASGERTVTPSSLGAITRDAIASKLPRVERG